VLICCFQNSGSIKLSDIQAALLRYNRRVANDHQAIKGRRRNLQHSTCYSAGKRADRPDTVLATFTVRNISRFALIAGATLAVPVTFVRHSWTTLTY
jgi:hypothetical protein